MVSRTPAMGTARVLLVTVLLVKRGVMVKSRRNGLIRLAGWRPSLAELFR